MNISQWPAGVVDRQDLAGFVVADIKVVVDAVAGAERE